MSDWRIEITTTGGFTGRGIGTMSASSKEASGDLNEAVEQAQPTTWQRDYSPGDGHPDEIRYTLTLTIAGRTHTTSWRDTSELPSDLVKITSLFNL